MKRKDQYQIDTTLIYLRDPRPLLASDKLLHIDRVVVFALISSFLQHLFNEIVNRNLRIHQFAGVLVHDLHHLLALVGFGGRIERIMLVPAVRENGLGQCFFF